MKTLEFVDILQNIAWFIGIGTYGFFILAIAFGIPLFVVTGMLATFSRCWRENAFLGVLLVVYGLVICGVAALTFLGVSFLVKWLAFSDYFFAVSDTQNLFC